VFLKEKEEVFKMGNLKKLPTAKNGDNFKVYLSFFNFFQKYQHIIFNTCPPLTPPLPVFRWRLICKKINLEKRRE
jgi:hypothetical protein